ncbi:hypothetical protein K2X30_00595 [bacterium]|nr:hypothetical protein [bacterium]
MLKPLIAALTTALALTSFARGEDMPPGHHHGGPANPAAGACVAKIVGIGQECQAFETLLAKLQWPSSLSSLPMDSLVEVQLLPETSFTKHVPAKKSANDRYGNLIPLTVPADGLYQISASTQIWFEVADITHVPHGMPAQALECQGFMMNNTIQDEQPSCKNMFKTVTYALKRNSAYVIQISNSVDAKTHLLVTATHPVPRIP